MAMSRSEAELRYDGPIPPGVVDPSLPHHPRHANAVRLANITPKPRAVFARMVQVMEIFAGAGALTEADLLRAGFSAAEIETHKADALRAMLCANPTFLTVELAA